MVLRVDLLSAVTIWFLGTCASITAGSGKAPFHVCLKFTVYRCGTFEAFELSNDDKKLFRSPGLSKLPRELGGTDFVDETEDYYLRSIYRSDYDRTLTKRQKKCEERDVRDEFIATPESDKPTRPLNSSLRVFPGPPRYYKTCKTEYKETYERVAEWMKSGRKAFS